MQQSQPNTKPKLTQEMQQSIDRLQFDTHPIVASIKALKQSNLVILERMKASDASLCSKYSFEEACAVLLAKLALVLSDYRQGLLLEGDLERGLARLRTLRSLLTDKQLLAVRNVYQQSKFYRRVPLDLLAELCADQGTVTQEGATVAQVQNQFRALNKERKAAAKTIGYEKKTNSPFKYVDLAHARFTKRYINGAKSRAFKQSMANRRCGFGVYTWQDLLTERERWAFNSTLRYWVKWRFDMKHSEKTKRQTRKGVPVKPRPKRK